MNKLGRGSEALTFLVSSSSWASLSRRFDGVVVDDDDDDGLAPVVVVVVSTIVDTERTK